jgi:hypothetical protein
MQPINVAFEYHNAAGDVTDRSVYKWTELKEVFGKGRVLVDTTRFIIPPGGRLEIYSIGPDDPRFRMYGDEPSPTE